MSLEKETFLTQEGLKKLEEKLEHLRTVRRNEVAERIKEARSFGDISENSEYEDAKNEQAFIEGEIAEIEKMLRSAKIIDHGDLDDKTVSIGSIVKVNDLEFDDEEEYTIVGSAEADPSANKISNQSPVGNALLGHQIGDIVEVQVPAGVIKFKILGIKK
ncbi:MAG: transcription elongation factor GreA [bacterium]